LGQANPNGNDFMKHCHTLNRNRTSILKVYSELLVWPRSCNSPRITGILATKTFLPSNEKKMKTAASFKGSPTWKAKVDSN
jgi:hypothetical protein